MKTTNRILLLLISLGVATQAHAYIGPGVGLSVIGTVVAFVAGMLMLIVGFVWYPFKRLLYKRMSVQPDAGQDADAEVPKETAEQSQAADEPEKK